MAGKRRAKESGAPAGRGDRARGARAGTGGKRARGAQPERVSRLRKPETLSLEAWQIALRRQVVLEKRLVIRNIGDGAVFSEYEVHNPETRRSYRVAIRGEQVGDNFCTCPDFSVNTLGTCKHIESVLNRLRRSRAARAALAAGFRPAYSEIYLHYGPQREVRFKQGADCPPSVAARAGSYFDRRGALRGTRGGGFHELLKDAARAHHEIRCYEDALGFMARRRDDAARSRRLDRMFPRGVESEAFDDLLPVNLYPYQRAGALFAARTGRCLVADEMGLGKTAQAIAGAEILSRLGAVERVLVVAPTSLKHQWQREIERFSGRSSVIVEGLLAERARRYAADSFFKITNYDVVHRDLEDIERWNPDLVILDEAQRIKNWKTRTAKSVKQLRSDHAFVLTGTPLENRLEELHSIVEFVDRYRLGPMFRFLAEHQHLDEHGRVVGYKNLASVTKTLEPILIRRKKDEVLKDLPERLEKHFFVAMTEEQMRHHEENREIVARIVAKWRRYGFLSEMDQRRLQIALQNMRMSCNSTYLLDRTTDHGVKADELAELLGEILEDPSAKVVVFSQWLRTHELIAKRLQRRGWDHVLFHGGIPGRERKGLIARFREEPDCRLFLSTDAGGVGLNLEVASVVVNMDQPWNPAVLEQRAGRVHRLGQQRPVRVVHFVAQGTIEEGMLSLLAFKKAMFAGVLEGGQDEVLLGGTRLTRFMESVETATGAIPEPMPRAADGDGAADPANAGGAGAIIEGAEDEERGAGRGGIQSDAPSEAAWGEVVTAGISLIEKLAQAMEKGAGEPAGRAPAAGPIRIDRDRDSGETYLRVQAPKPETLRRILDLLAGLKTGK